VGLVARVVEEAGIPTVSVSTGRDITALVRPPRSLFVNYPMGNTFGRAGDAAMQTRILRDALDFAVTAEEPGVLVDLPYEWGDGFEYFTGPTTPEAVEKQLKK
jgi:D-proline reductase (dithiol) PrdB